MRETHKIEYFPKTSKGIALETGEARVYTLTELGNPVWAKDKEKIRGIFARVEERENEWRMFLFERMGMGRAPLVLAADALAAAE